MGQPDIASELFAAAKQLEQQATHGSVASHRQWMGFQIGELATATSIGDIEQALPGEDDELDAYLRRSGKAVADAASVSLGEPGAV